jgi:hypothetical protein
MLISPSVVFIRVPGRKQEALHVVHSPGVAADAPELRRYNPNATPVPTATFEAARKLRRDVESVAFPLALVLTELLPSSGKLITKSLD